MNVPSRLAGQGSEPLAEMARGNANSMGPVLRRRAQVDPALPIGSTAWQVLNAAERVQTDGKSEALLMWPQRPDSIAIFHALSALTRLANCDTRPLLTVFYPWNRNVMAGQRTLLVDRDFIDRAVLGPLNRIAAVRPQHPAFGYVMALHSLRHVMSSRKKNTRLERAVAADPGLLHPTLLDMTPQSGAYDGGILSYDNQFLRRLRRHTWIGERQDHMDAATDALRTPFFLYGIHSEAATAKSLRSIGLNPKHGGRTPNLLLLDLTRRARERMEYWRRALPTLLGLLSDLYGAASPPALAITDDPFVLQGLRWEVLKRYDVRRHAAVADNRPTRAAAILSANPDVLEERDLPGGTNATTIHVDAYGTDVLNLVESGLKLRKSLITAGDQENADVVTQAINVAQALVGLPGSATQLYDFLNAFYEGNEKQTLGQRFDHQTPLSKMRAVLQRGLAGPNHSSLSKFVTNLDALCRATQEADANRRLFDDSLRRIVAAEGRAMLICSNEFICGFITWRLQNDPELTGISSDRLALADRREALEVLQRADSHDSQFDRLFFVEPQADDLLHVLVSQRLPVAAVVLSNLARAEQTLRRVRILLDLSGTEPARPMLESVKCELERVLGARASDIPDLEIEPTVPQFGTLDLTGAGVPPAGARRVLTTSSGLRIRAYDGTELAVYDPDALQVFSRKLAKDLRPDDRICVFTPDFVAMAREKLNLTRDAPEILALYHNTVLQAVQRLEGKDIAAKVSALRARMLRIDSNLDLPGDQAIRYWIDIGHLANEPRHKVTPHAPRDRQNFLCFMKALGVAEDVSRHYWDLGVFWTRSMRIRTGFSFHQVFMSILIDPHGTASWLPANRRDEVWRIYETAEQHVVTVVANKQEAES